MTWKPKRKTKVVEPKVTHASFVMEWVTGDIKSEQEGNFRRHYLVSASGEIVGDVDEPTDGRLAYFADLYGGSKTCWLTLEMAKDRVEMDHAHEQYRQIGNKSR